MISLFTSVVIAFILWILCRVVYLMWNAFYKDYEKREGYATVKSVIVIGSGGHTSEMIRLIMNISPRRYSPRVYLLADGDVTSEMKVHLLEARFKSLGNEPTKYEIVRVPRSREVGQSYFTSIFTTLYSILYCIPIMLKERPHLVLCNGPGTCIPICLIAFAMKVFYISNATIVFVESICRVSTLSLTGKILMFFADLKFVQWPQLHEKYSHTKYIGRLV